MAVNGPEDLIPEELLSELRWLAERDRIAGGAWMDLSPVAGSDAFDCVLRCSRLPPLIDSLVSNARGGLNQIKWTELCGMLCATAWLKDQPRIVRTTPEQLEAFQHVAVNLPLRELSVPFSAVYVDTPIAPFRGCLVYRHSDTVMILQLYSEGNMNDVVCAVRDAGDGSHVEKYLQTVSEDLTHLLARSVACQRVALNVLLALSNYGFREGPLFPKAYAEDVSLSKRPGGVGERAKERVKRASYRVEFARPLVVRRPSPPAEGGAALGQTTRAHWVRGHWKMQPHGPGRSLRKHILIKPYLTGQGDAPKGPVVYVDAR